MLAVGVGILFLIVRLVRRWSRNRIGTPANPVHIAAQPRYDPSPVLDGMFAGAPTVTYQLGPTSLPFDTVVGGAARRGYRLQLQDGPVLVFTRASSEPPQR